MFFIAPFFLNINSNASQSLPFFFLFWYLIIVSAIDVLFPMRTQYNTYFLPPCGAARRALGTPVSTCCLLCESNREETRETRTFHCRFASSRARPKTDLLYCVMELSVTTVTTVAIATARHRQLLLATFWGYFARTRQGYVNDGISPPTPPHSFSGDVFHRGAETNGVMVYSHRRPPQVPSRPSQW